MNPPIHILRQQMRGDVLLTTPIVRAIHERQPPGRRIIYFTDYPMILKGNRAVSLCIPTLSHPLGANNATVINLEVAYEKMPKTHLIDAFAQGAGLKPGQYNKRLEIYPTHEDDHWATKKMSTMVNRDSKNKTKIVIVAAGPGKWPGRNWDEGNWQAVCNDLLMLGVKIVLMGLERNYRLSSSMDLRAVTTMHQMAAVFKLASAFVGIDSFPAHVAGAVACPRVVLFGITHGKYILCDSPHTVAVESDSNHPFAGARHCVERISAVKLGNPPDNPMRTIGVKQVLDSVISIL